MFNLFKDNEKIKKKYKYCKKCKKQRKVNEYSSLRSWVCNRCKKERARIAAKKYKKKYPAKWKESSRKSKEKRKKSIALYAKIWKENNKIKVRLYTAKRRAILNTHISEQDIKHIHAAQDGKCLYCDKYLTEYQIDHFIPLSKQGVHMIENLVVACPDCNRRKHNKYPWEWEGWGGKYPIRWKNFQQTVSWLNL